MEKNPFELLVEEALLETAAREWSPALSGAEDRPPPYSTQYLTWEKRFLRNPFGYAKRHSRPVWQWALRTAACVLLTVSVAFGGLMAVNPTARAWVQQIIAEWFGDHARFSFSGEAGKETGAWRTGYLPEGFELVSEDSASKITLLIYEDDSGMRLLLFYTLGSNGSFGIDSNSHAHEKIYILGNSGYLLRATISSEPNSLIWTDTSTNTAFQLASKISPEELIKVAESICKQ